jgi:hypothetical protein
MPHLSTLIDLIWPSNGAAFTMGPVPAIASAARPKVSIVRSNPPNAHSRHQLTSPSAVIVSPSLVSYVRFQAETHDVSLCLETTPDLSRACQGFAIDSCRHPPVHWRLPTAKAKGSAARRSREIHYPALLSTLICCSS